jgi:chorismate mutase
MSKQIAVLETGESPEAGLDELRRRIEEVDMSLLDLITRRCHLARSAGDRKRLEGMAVVDPAQEASVLRRAAARARDAGLEEERVRQLFWCLIDLSRTAQMNGNREDRR